MLIVVFLDPDTFNIGTAHVQLYEVTASITAPDPNPEPTTIEILGIGIAGLAGVGARCKWKKKAVDKS